MTASVTLSTLAMFVPATTFSCEAAIASCIVFLPVLPILVMVMLPAGLKVALPPKMVSTLLATLPNTSLVACSWLPLIASVLVAVIAPGATFTIWRSAPMAPTLTTPAAVPA